MLSLILLPVSLYLAATVDASASCECDDVHFFLARGNNEPYPGRQAALVEATCDGLASCGYEDLIYSALYTDLYCQTNYDGTIAGHVQLTQYAARCPDAKLILGGYSQGAEIVINLLGGSGGTLFNGCVEPPIAGLDPTTSPGNKIAAAIVFGDTRHTANQPYNFGNGSAIDGLFPRDSAQITAALAYQNVARDWCLQTDPICAADQTDSIVADHLDYYDLYSEEAASWIKSVASLTNLDPSFTTSIALSLSGTAQNYATIGTATPSGTVTQTPTWTDALSIVSASCAATSSSVIVSTTTGTTTSVSGTSSTTITSSSTITSSVSITSSSVSGAPLSPTGKASTSPSSALVELKTATSSGASGTSTAKSGASQLSNTNLSVLLLCIGFITFAAM